MHNKQHLMRHALNRWREKGILLKLNKEHEEIAKRVQIASSLDNLTSILHNQYIRTLFYGLSRMRLSISQNKIKLVAISRLQSFLNHRLSDGFSAILASIKLKGPHPKTK